MKGVRIADKNIYSNEKYFDQPKEYYKLILSEIKQFDNKISRIIDIGCSNGSLLNFLMKQMSDKKITYVGYEPEKSLIEYGKKINKKILFNNYGLYEIPNLSNDEKGDVTIASGVIGIFEDPKKFINRLIECTRSNGVVYIFSPFNEENIDVILKYKYHNKKSWEIGHNLFSMASMESICKELGYQYNWKPFKMPFSIKKTKDPMRSWTEKFRNDENQIIYGTNMFTTMKLLSIYKNT
tara:strand:+ start:10214 stop:10927 length:714 start_codon:yes stop_codon:yes gene_type:complete